MGKSEMSPFNIPNEMEQSKGSCLPIIKCSLEPLLGIGVGSVLVEIREMTTESSDSLTAHRISFIRHCTATNLVFLERSRIRESVTYSSMLFMQWDI
jgi:hypothetical protein